MRQMPTILGCVVLAELSLAGCAATGDHQAGDLTVVSVTPADAAGNVALDAVIVVELAEPPAPDFDAAVASASGDPVPHATQIAGTTVRITPADPLALASDYRITIAAGARAASGDTLQTAYTSEFTTRDGAWSARQISSMTRSTAAAASLGVGSTPSLAVAADGTVLASWESGADVFDQRFTPGTGWSAANGTVAVHDPDSVQIALATSTRAFAAFADVIGGTHTRIVTRTFDGAGWSAPATAADYLVDAVTYDQYAGGVAMDSASRALTFHRGSFELDSFKLYALVDTGSGWGSPIAVGGELPGSALKSVIARDNHGGYVIAWVQRVDTQPRTQVWMATLGANGALGAPVQLDDGVGNVFALSVASAGDRVQLAWIHEEPNVATLRVVTRGLVAGALEPAHAVAVDGFTFGGESLKVACNAHQAVVAWTQLGGVFAQVGSGTTWSTTATIAPLPTSIGDSAGAPVVALDDHDNAVIAWTRIPTSGTRTTWLDRLHAGQWSAPLALGDATGNTYAFAVGVDAAGRVTAMYDREESSTVTGYSVWAARLE